MLDCDSAEEKKKTHHRTDGKFEKGVVSLNRVAREGF